VSVVVGRLYGYGFTMQELSREDGRYVMRTYNVDPDSERTISVSEAMEWVEMMRAHGGAVYRDVTSRPDESSAQPTAAAERTT
jgi:hypothetical protein